METLTIIDTGKETTSQLMADFKKRFNVYCYWNDAELDKEFPAPGKPTERKFRAEQESSAFKWKSWMDKSDMMTLREYILFFEAYHKETGKYPDEKEWTLFKDSLSDGRVAYGSGYPGSRKVGFGWYCPVRRGSGRGARVAISLNPSPLVLSVAEDAILEKAKAYVDERFSRLIKALSNE